MSAHERRIGATILKRLRHGRGWSLADLARALCAIADELGQPLSTSRASVQRSVARWESGAAATVPGERYQLLLAHLYAIDTHDRPCLGDGSDFAELLTALAHFGAIPERLRDLRTLVARTTTASGVNLLALLAPGTQRSLAAALHTPARLDDHLLAALRSAADQVNQQVGSIPFVRLQLLLAPVTESCRRLLTLPVPLPLQAALHLLAADTFRAAGRFAFETRDDQASQALYGAAAEASTWATSWQRAIVLMSHALVSLYSVPGLAAARSLIDAAVREARLGHSPAVRARAHALQSEIAARSGLPHHAQAALSMAWYDLERDSADDPAAAAFSAAHLRGFEGVSALYVGAPAHAHDYFSRAAESLTTSREQVQRSIVVADQARARIRLGDPRSAADLLHGCIEAATHTGGRVAAIRLRHARQDLRPWRSESWVTDLDDHLIDALGA